jgi:hypothetical protein
LTAEATTTAYGILEKNNLPRVLLPKGVQSYVLIRDGKLEVTVSGECNFFVNLGNQKFKLQFASTFSGIVHAGSITEAYGVDVQVKFAWLGFSQVNHAGDTFHVKHFTQSFPVSGFAVTAIDPSISTGQEAPVSAGSPSGTAWAVLKWHVACT